MSDKTVLSRRDLYELVWSTPLTKLAGQFGISDRGLAKICERHRVPSPPRGYWAKLEAGGKPKRAIFVETNDAALNVVEINATLSNLPEEVRDIIEKARVERKTRKTPRRNEGCVELPHVDQVHPILAATAKALRRHQGLGIVAIAGPGLISLRIGAESIERVISLLDTLLRRLTEKGFSVELTERGIKVSLEPEAAVFTLLERTKHESHEPTQEELVAEKRRQEKIERSRRAGSWDFDLPPRAYPATDEIAQGELVLQIEGWSDGVRRRWADGRRQRLEILLDSIVAGFEVLLAARKAQRLAIEERQRKQAELARRQNLAEERRAREKKRGELLRDIIVKSTEAETIRKWLAAIDIDDSIEDPELSKFLNWVHTKLSELESATSRGRVAKVIREQSLFPEVDNLHDPLGEPPRRYYYGMSLDEE